MDSIQHHGADSPWVIPVRDLTRGAGVQRELTAEWPAPAGVSTPLLGIPEGDPVELDLRLESVHEGVLVTGTADATLKGECGRCLRPLHEGITVDLEPVFRDAVVIALPFQPLCRPDCEGLCADCGIRLEDAPEGHAHERVDPRWAALAHLAGTSETSITETEER